MTPDAAFQDYFWALIAAHTTHARSWKLVRLPRVVALIIVRDDELRFMSIRGDHEVWITRNHISQLTSNYSFAMQF